MWFSRRHRDPLLSDRLRPASNYKHNTLHSILRSWHRSSLHFRCWAALIGLESFWGWHIKGDRDGDFWVFVWKWYIIDSAFLCVMRVNGRMLSPQSKQFRRFRGSRALYVCISILFRCWLFGIVMDFDDIVNFWWNMMISMAIWLHHNDHEYRCRVYSA